MSTRKGGRGGAKMKKTSGEEKKTKRLEQTAKAKALKELVDTAHQVEDYLSIFQPFRTYEKTTTMTTNDGDSNGTEQFKVYLKDFSPSVFTSSAAPSILQWMFDLTKRHMQPQ
jgi:hypothetical protein